MGADEDFGSPPKFGKTKSFTVNVKIQEHPGKLKVGYTPLVLIRTAKAPCKVAKINWKVTKATKSCARKRPNLKTSGRRTLSSFRRATSLKSYLNHKCLSVPPLRNAKVLDVLLFSSP